MVEIPEHLDRLLQNLVGLAALDIDHESHAAGVVFKPRIIEALLRWQTGRPRAGNMAASTASVHFLDTRKGAIRGISGGVAFAASRARQAPAGIDRPLPW